jgi:hypothetical protein
MVENQSLACGVKIFLQNSCKKVREKFGSYLKSRTFALPFEKRMAESS